MVDIVAPREVTTFWFDELEERNWFEKNEEIDRAIRKRFMDTHLALSAHVPQEWRETPEAALALIIVFDQFPRNIFRNSPHAFASDPLALKEATLAIEKGFDLQTPEKHRLFIYIPFEHSESIEDQNRSVALFETLNDENLMKYALAHRDVIEKYGRFPHRNAILGRVSTPEEEAYLAKPGAGF
ncbi:DUF924 domain-containing protein [Hoeflea sp. WL0058]|uniref:DUF924 domain-containing protein n=1 Tax=Flavimaribacter sediminis TaxID=2865987 RepID=A0AAE2ZG56_9HYPH|nr:DUF924 family protein [Flavimaribacter sediminis]MBW8635958.1 DUF924 domain-containing protein [Flavimaribacter sediminis]